MAAPVSAAGVESDWAQRDERRMLHAVYRVGDMDATIKFYKECLGMQLLRYRDLPEVGGGAPRLRVRLCCAVLEAPAEQE